MNAVQCAITINHIAKLINDVFVHVDFKCGIGIDYGEMKVLKVGVQKNGDENITNKNLIWVGYPSNIASRLTDVANKILTSVSFRIKYNEYNINYLLSSLDNRRSGLFYKISEPEFIEKNELLNSEDFIKHMDFNLEGKMTYKSYLILSLSKEKKEFDLPPILCTESVFKGYKLAAPNCDSIKNEWWEEISYPIKNVKNKVFGSDLTWVFND